MTNRLEEIRALKEMIANTASTGRRRRGMLMSEEPEDNEDDFVIPMRIKNKKIKNKKTTTSIRSKRTFKEWFIEVADFIEEITGMELDVLPDIPWSKMYRDKMTVDEAVHNALRIAEEDVEEDFSNLSYSDWLSGVNEELLSSGNDTTEEMRKNGALTHSKLHMLYMDYRDPNDAVGEILKTRVVSKTRVTKEDVDWISRLDRKRGPDLSKLMRSLGMSSSKISKTKELPIDESQDDEETIPVYSDRCRVNPIDEALGIMPVKESVDMDIIKNAIEGVNKDKRKSGKVNIEEASVLGGDFGRWGSATAAASATGSGIAKKISNGDVKYTFNPDGIPQSGEGGTTLWFNFSPDKKDVDNYWIGFQISGDKEDPNWGIKIKKGKGLGSSSTVASKTGLKSSDLKSASIGIKNELGK